MGESLFFVTNKQFSPSKFTKSQIINLWIWRWSINL